ncbi:hypothetical protein AHAS_Ahas02G0105000 [Arachis hypogaea]
MDPFSSSPSVIKKPKYWFAFSVTVLPLGFSTYYLSKTTQTATILDTYTPYKSRNQKNTIEVGPENLKLIYYKKEAKLTEYINSKSKIYNLDGALLFHFIPLHLSL